MFAEHWTILAYTGNITTTLNAAKHTRTGPYGVGEGILDFNVAFRASHITRCRAFMLTVLTLLTF
jgi:hypothetical protein